jgi:hypothetical protein
MRRTIIAITGLALLSGAAAAQTAPEPPGRTPSSVAPQGGVIQPPPHIDPGIQTKLPNPNPDGMAVIPPLGSPSNNPAVQPK